MNQTFTSNSSKGSFHLHDPNDPDCVAAMFYEDSKNLKPAGPPNRRERRPLSKHVPIRLDDVMMNSVRRSAETEGTTVSSWIRQAIRMRLKGTLS